MGEERTVPDVEQVEDMFLFITSECSLGYNVGNLASGIVVFHLKVGIKVNYVK